MAAGLGSAYGWRRKGGIALTSFRYYGIYRIMKALKRSLPPQAADVTRFADVFSAMGTEPRLRIMRLLLSACPDGMVVGEIQSALDISPSTLSHHLEKLKAEKLVTVLREGTFLRYAANTETLQELLSFLYAECCTRNQAIAPETIIKFPKR